MRAPGYRNWRAGLAPLLGAVLVACGGGGGTDDGSSTEASTSISLTTANRDAVAHAAAASFMIVGVTGAVPLSAAPGAEAQGTGAALGIGPFGSVSRLSRRVIDLLRGASRATVLSGAGAIARPLSIIGSSTEPCAMGGTTTMTFDDRDADFTLSVGDVLTFVFNDCRDVAAETLNGTIAVTLTTIGQAALTSFSGRMSYVQLADEATDHRHGMVLNGAHRFEYTQTSATSETLRLVADGPLVGTVHTHTFGSDTITQLSGFTMESSHDAAAAGPGGTSGLTVTTMSGLIESAGAGGIVEVSMPGAPIESFDGELYPHAGVLQVRGQRGVVRLTAVSADQIRIDLDDNDDALIESSRTDTWDWLL